MKERPLISAEQQVSLLAERGVRFEIMGMEDAVRFLREKNLFFKVKAFTKCFSTYFSEGSGKCGRYINLDFAYLTELTKLDHHLRELVLSMVLEIEHCMKVHLNTAMMDDGLDGKKVIDRFFEHEQGRKERLLRERFDSQALKGSFEKIKDLASRADEAAPEEELGLFLEILDIAETQTKGIDPRHFERGFDHMRGSSYTRGLAKKYGRREAMYVWSYLELASFGDILALYKFYFYDLRGKRDKKAESVKQFLFPVKALRNVAAHNGNVLNTIGQKLPKPIGAISKAAREELGIDGELVALTRRFPIVHDFTALILCFDRLVEDAGARTEQAERLRKLRHRFLRHIHYFSKQAELNQGMRMLVEIMESGSERLSLGDQ